MAVLPTIMPIRSSKPAMKRLVAIPIALIVTLAAARGERPAAFGAASAVTKERPITHVLNRVAFGPRPGDLEKVRAIGIHRYVDQQLHPERLADPEIGRLLESLTTIGMSSRDIAERFEAPMLQARRARRTAAANGSVPPGAPPGVPGAAAGLGPPPGRDPQMEPANRVMIELAEQKLLRAIYSERQLQEVLTDFWFNHFNVDARKGPERFMLTEYEREAIRPHVLGRFRDLLEHTARSPAMLFYLDNWMSAAEPDGGLPPGQTPRRSNRRGLNENYARELMELHTLGIDGGYTQKDVVEVARAFTGWTIDNPRLGGGFRFHPRLHDAGEKIVLGHRIKAGGGISDGEQVLDILAEHPSTARFIATGLVRRFVSDHPPASLVNRAAARFSSTHGDLREVMRTILTSPDFMSAASYRTKIKTPYEFVVSALRATAADVRDARPLVRALQQLGMPLYQCQPPTGYQDSADAWMNTGALVNRMNFAVALANNQLRGISIADPESARRLLGPELSDSTRATIAKAATPGQALALSFGAPEFQRR
jgi:uncharacterized protein (DUF1800 family)